MVLDVEVNAECVKKAGREEMQEFEQHQVYVKGIDQRVLGSYSEDSIRGKIGRHQQGR